MPITFRPTALLISLPLLSPGADFERLSFNNPDLTVDLGVGLWAMPLPMDWDGDGDLDLIVSCPDKPFNGTYLFENPDGSKMPVFKAPVRVGKGFSNIRVSYVEGTPRILIPGAEFVDFLGGELKQTRKLSLPSVKLPDGNVRAKQWKFVDYDGDGDLDLSYGAGSWGAYGWDDGFNDKGKWVKGPLQGFVIIVKNTGTDEEPIFQENFRVQADGKDAEVYGMPSPNFADFDGDGDLDLLCGEFLDGFTYFQNTGTRTEPVYAPGRYLTKDGEKVAMHVQMITPTVLDWDRDGDFDIICGDEDGRVALVENTGKFADGLPAFNQPVHFQQEADLVKYGALVTPFSFDWDHDGDEDLICGNTSGNIGFIENLGGGATPKWAKPVDLKAAGKTIHLQAGPNGSIQGPAEAKWGYTVLNIADWDLDGLPDIITNDIWGKIRWFKNSGTKTEPKLEAARPVEIDWQDDPKKPAWNWWNPEATEFISQWRTTPCVLDWDRDGLPDIVMLDHEGYLAFFKREIRGDSLTLLPGKRIFRGNQYTSKQALLDKSDPNGLLRLNPNEVGGSGRRKLCFADWDGDGDLDLIVNSVNAHLLLNEGTADGFTTFGEARQMSPRKLAGHTTCPTVVDWNRDGKPDLLLGAEDGHFYSLKNPGP